eukprot:TRINITY_DN12406_c0_g1_i1.p1 TRINITY_DN12406_c0_g1~~TRINITY_DN12406_c0_g1_i1.p1  ORF type:complete len:250 (-),score=77.35 TRINITY_DN12406_c0_g1_i1:26-775(-)
MLFKTNYCLGLLLLLSAAMGQEGSGEEGSGNEGSGNEAETILPTTTTVAPTTTTIQPTTATTVAATETAPTTVTQTTAAPLITTTTKITTQASTVQNTSPTPLTTPAALTSSTMPRPGPVYPPVQPQFPTKTPVEVLSYVQEFLKNWLRRSTAPPTVQAAPTFIPSLLLTPAGQPSLGPKPRPFRPPMVPGRGSIPSAVNIPPAQGVDTQRPPARNPSIPLVPRSGSLYPYRQQPRNGYSRFRVQGFFK